MQSNKKCDMGFCCRIFVSMGQANMLACSFDPQIKVERFSFNLIAL